MTAPARWTAILTTALAAGLSAGSRRALAGEEKPGRESAWQASALLGTTAVQTNNVLPVPLAIGGGLLLERGVFGIEGAVHLDLATLCDNPDTGGDGHCGPFWILDVAPRLTAAPEWSFSPYLAARAQLTSSRNHGLVPAAGPRLGVRYRGRELGFYLEAGPSIFWEDGGYFGFSDRTWFPQVSTGILFLLR